MGEQETWILVVSRKQKRSTVSRLVVALDLPKRHLRRRLLQLEAVASLYGNIPLMEFGNDLAHIYTRAVIGKETSNLGQIVCTEAVIRNDALARAY